MFKEFPEDDNKTDDFLNEFRQKISDQNIESLEEKHEELKRSKSVFLGIAGGVALAGIVGWMILAPQYRVESEKEIPVIRRPQTAIRVQPNEPGGMEIPDQDKTVYNIIEKKDDTTVENLLPEPEAPKLPAIAPETETPAVSPVIAEAEQIVQKAESSSTPIEEGLKQAEAAAPKVVVAEINSSSQEPAKTAVETAQEPKPEVKEQAKTETKQEAKTETKQEVKTETKPEAPKQTVVAKGSWQIQLMSSPNKPAVEKAKIDLGKKYKISHLPFEIESAILDQNKTFYRLKVGSFKTRAEADKLCNDIKTLGGTCIVKKK